MNFDLKKPCKNCPFAKAETRIKFRCRERAEEIAEQAYRSGFPCHLSAEYQESEDDGGVGDGGYVFGAETQHCAGALGVMANDYLMTGSPWPAIDNSEDMAEKIIERMGPENLALCFESEEDFIEANNGEE